MNNNLVSDPVANSQLSPILKVRADSITQSQISQLESLDLLKRRSTSQDRPNHNRSPQPSAQIKSAQHIPESPPAASSAQRSAQEKKLSQTYQQSKNRTLVSKMRLKLQEQAGQARRQLKEKERQLASVDDEIGTWEGALKRKRLTKQDKASSQQTLLFRQTQLSNLVMINAQIVEAAKREVNAQRKTTQKHRAAISHLRQQIQVLRQARTERQSKRQELAYLASTQQLLKERVESLRRTQRQKSRIRTQATIQVIRQIAKDEKGTVANEIEEKLTVLRRIQQDSRSISDFEEILAKVIPPQTYLTCSQLKLLPEFSRVRPRHDAQQILGILEEEVVVENVVSPLAQSPPPQLRQINEQLARLAHYREGQLEQIQRGEEQVEALRTQKKKLVELFHDNRRKEH